MLHFVERWYICQNLKPHWHSVTSYRFYSGCTGVFMNVLSLFQDPFQGGTSHLIVVSPWSPIMDSFSVFPGHFWKNFVGCLSIWVYQCFLMIRLGLWVWENTAKVQCLFHHILQECLWKKLELTLAILILTTGLRYRLSDLPTVKLIFPHFILCALESNHWIPSTLMGRRLSSLSGRSKQGRIFMDCL